MSRSERNVKRVATRVVLAAAIATCLGVLPAAMPQTSRPGSTVIFDMDAIRHRAIEKEDKDKKKVPVGTVELVDGKFGKACKFSFAEGMSGGFFIAGVKADKEWDESEGFSFHVKGDGSMSWGGIELIDKNDWLREAVATLFLSSDRIPRRNSLSRSRPS